MALERLFALNCVAMGLYGVPAVPLASEVGAVFEFKAVMSRSCSLGLSSPPQKSVARDEEFIWGPAIVTK